MGSKLKIVVVPTKEKKANYVRADMINSLQKFDASS